MLDDLPILEILNTYHSIYILISTKSKMDLKHSYILNNIHYKIYTNIQINFNVK